MIGSRTFRIPIDKLRMVLYPEEKDLTRTNKIVQTQIVTVNEHTQTTESDFETALALQMMNETIRQHNEIQESIEVAKSVPPLISQDIFDTLERGEAMLNDEIEPTPPGIIETDSDESNSSTDSVQSLQFPAILNFIRENRTLRSITRGKFGRIYSKKYMQPIIHYK